MDFTSHPIYVIMDFIKTGIIGKDWNSQFPTVF